MSYLVDALKKAERERHVNQRADMRSLADGEPPSQGLSAGHTLRWLVALLVVCNTALLMYLFLPVDRADIAGNAPAQQSQVAAAGDESDEPKQPASGAAPGAPGDRPGRAPEDRSAQARKDPRVSPALREDRVQANTRNPRPQASESGTGGVADMRRSDPAPARRGRVTYSQTPLDSAAAALRAPARDRPVPRTTPTGPAPDVSINGHLYSTVPGRSFILVGGRRYHEGERLAAGPAVESIDASGATLNYRGDRYHIDGPR